MEPVVGQIWKEVDPRKERYVRIEERQGNWIKIRSVTKLAGSWVYAPHSQFTSPRAERFNGKRGGYEFHASE